MTTIAIVDNDGNNFQYTTCGIPDGFIQATQAQIDAYNATVTQKTNLVNQITAIVASATPFQKRLYYNVFSSILNDVNAGNWADLQLLVNDTSVPPELQSIQVQIKAILPTS
jgi:hypothetical protein